MRNDDERLRPVDLARLAGISTQQVRNYEEAGVLPPAARTASGYRTFTDAHRRALLTYRALLRGYGPVTAAGIMRAVHTGDVPAALALVDAAHAALHEERTALRATSEALETLTEAPPAELPPAGLRIGEVAALLGVRTSALRVWEAAGLITPERERGTRYRVYRPADVRDARLIHTLRRSHYLFDQIRPVLDGLRREGSSAALRAAIAARGEQLTARTRTMLSAAGLLHDYLEHVEGVTG
ncbi:MerR family transcriptional regulator [Streptomyces sp. ISL-22]|uniref:MerR family transcriptional regulator n=1 Tax=unclassified Streptomyces TaxID=2593676 RepID=UPI001BE7E9A5|nr:MULTISPECIES: MerR family transcriptional regulator [unclassified Streptomyces]MBT2419121.1 MerR family transcriptional regulator [Streptomyces sp. ISL-24]MBT2431216.1 MerR family transcriptional regulator [Streptomyces sp. ISL-22]